MADLNHSAGDEHIIEAFSGDGRVEAVYLLGSAAKGQMRPGSDIDIAILPVPGSRLNAFELNAMASPLALELGRDVDVGILSSANLIYAYQTIMTGHRVFVRDSSVADNAAACLLGMYGQFNLERKKVTDAYST